MPKKISSIILWSLIAAAFIGPGTITTASAAGASYQYDLMWALAFAVFACIVLQEASAKLSIQTSLELPALLGKLYPGKFSKSLIIAIGGSVILGCLAYEAGNMLGAISGIQLFTSFSTPWILTIITIGVAALLALGKPAIIGNFLSVIVALMGITFLYLVFQANHPWPLIAKGFTPSVPSGSLWMILGLVGTTVVPYNLFLGSGISKGQSIREMRIGLYISVILGGLISMAILINGSLLQGSFSFVNLAASLDAQLGSYGSLFLGLGLFAAGFSSAITAPFAAAIISRGIWTKNPANSFHLTWIIVLGGGFIFGISGLKPIPLIILAQATNGLILPLIAISLWLLVNHAQINNGKVASVRLNLSFLIVTSIAILLGMNQLWNLLAKWLDETIKPYLLIGVTGILLVFIFLKIKKIRLSRR